MLNNKIKFMVLGLCSMSMTACMTNEEVLYTPGYQSYMYDPAQPYATPDYRFYNLNYNYQNQPNQANQGVSVPDSYHVGQYHSPVSFKDRDQNWVSSQNPQGYTIELAEGEKASQVANKLYKVPKNDRMAQIKSQRNGKSYYKGVYGTYNSAADAQKALDALPPDIKQGAGVKNWGSVQSTMDQ